MGVISYAAQKPQLQLAVQQFSFLHFPVLELPLFLFELFPFVFRQFVEQEFLVFQRTEQPFLEQPLQYAPDFGRLFRHKPDPAARGSAASASTPLTGQPAGRLSVRRSVRPETLLRQTPRLRLLSEFLDGHRYRNVLRQGLLR